MRREPGQCGDTHCDIPSEERSRLGVTNHLIRHSAGLEDPRDLIANFEQSFETMFGGSQ
ncbi:MAG: PLP-dependent transferase [Janthinobacterium lividum]